MNIKKRTSIGVVGYNIEDVNLNEMRQLSELKNRIEDVLNSHKPEAKEKRYISDDDLQLMRAILCVFTKEFVNDDKSSFDDFLKEEAEKEKKPESPAPVDDAE